jgi:hypothetical protein
MVFCCVGCSFFQKKTNTPDVLPTVLPSFKNLEELTWRMRRKPRHVGLFFKKTNTPDVLPAVFPSFKNLEGRTRRTRRKPRHYRCAVRLNNDHT